MKIVDEFTGRILEGRRWSEGIHQAVEAKEGVKIKEENQTLATITLQNYFRMYDKLAGMTGTAATEAAELMNTYELGVVPIPTNKPVVRADQRRPDLQGRGGQVRRRRRATSPSATTPASRCSSARSASRRASTCRASCSQRGIPHEVLNAKQHTREAAIVAQAGRLHAVTVATNMAGRGVDIMLGGNPEGLARHEVLKEGHAAEVMVDDVRRCRCRSSRCPRSSARPGPRRWPATTSCSPSYKPECAGRGRQGPRARRPVRHRLRAPRVAAHRQPAARPLRPPGRSRREPLLPQPRRRADAPVRHRRAVAT